MRVLLSWLKEYVDFDADLDEVAGALTDMGLRVETISRPGEGIEGVVVAEVLSVHEHPKADKLVVAEVSIGSKEHRVVAGARNFSKGDRVPLAPPGARLPGGLEIGTRKLRGVTSEGMLCSAKELGVGEDHTGILILAPATSVGDDVTEVLGLNDPVLTLEITPNRPDAMGMLGVARELAASLAGKVRIPQVELKEGSRAAADLASVEVEDPEGCPRYLARVITGLKVGPSPEWVQRRLVAAGFRPISNVVDATNYALLVTGHPMHPFDLSVLRDRKIVVRRARDGEPLRTIDGEERKLTADDLVIADAEVPVGIAGVMGGLESEVSGGTTEVLLESAHFDGRSILRTARRHGVRTEASARFERGTDPNNIAYAAEMAASLMVEWSGGEVASGPLDFYPAPVLPWRVTLRPKRARQVMGVEVGDDEMVRALTRLGLEASKDDGTIEAVVTSRRADLRIEDDLIEEVARVVGYEKIPARLPPSASRKGVVSDKQRLAREVRRILTGSGLLEAYCDALIGPEDLQKMGYPENHPYSEALPITNAMVRDESLLRPSLLPGLLASASRNVARRSIEIRLFEIGNCFLPSDETLPREPWRLGILMHGPFPQEWYREEREADFFDLKGVVEDLLRRLQLEEVAFSEVDEHPFHPTRSARISWGESAVGIAGEVLPEVCARYDLTHRTYAAELDLVALMSASREVTGVVEPRRYPAVFLDLAVAVAEEVRAAEVVRTAEGAGGELLESVRIFDVYRGEQVGEGRKSVALALSFRHPERTLEEPQALEARDRIAAAIEKKFGGQVRGG